MAQFPLRPGGASGDASDEFFRGPNVGTSFSVGDNQQAGLIDDELQQFIDMLRGEGGILSQFGDVADRFRGISEGNDPRFEAFRQQQLAGARRSNAQFFGRAGLAGTGASQNALNRNVGQINTNLDFAQLGAAGQRFDSIAGRADRSGGNECGAGRTVDSAIGRTERGARGWRWEWRLFRAILGALNAT